MPVLAGKGRNVVLDKSYGAPRITKDGVTVAKEIALEDKFENMGAQIVREVASNTSDIVETGNDSWRFKSLMTIKQSALASSAQSGQLRRRQHYR